MSIVFCGVGALGSTAAVLCRSLGAELRLVDFDRVESKNLTAQAYVKQSLGKNKAEALKLQLWNFWAVKAEAVPVRVVADNVAQVCAGADLVVDCFDNQASRQVLSTHARATRACRWSTPRCQPTAASAWSAGTSASPPTPRIRPARPPARAASTCPSSACWPRPWPAPSRTSPSHGIRRDAIVSLNAVQTM